VGDWVVGDIVHRICRAFVGTLVVGIFVGVRMGLLVDTCVR
jgi:F0F1-type ATP synthase assembly protein I